MITFLHAADLHLDAPFSGLSPAQAAKRREEQLALVRELFERGSERGCTLALLAGDLFDAPEVRPDTLEQVQRACAGFHGPIFIAPGNHDCCKPGGVYSIGGWPENVHIFTSREISRVELPDCTVYGAGFAQVCENAMLDGFHAEGGKTSLMVLHGDCLQKDSPYDPITKEQIERSNLTYLALGHIHQASGLLRAGGTFYAWPGCAMGRGFDELGEKGVYFGRITDSGEVFLEFAPLGGRKYEILRVEAGDDALSAIEQALPRSTQDDIYRIILTGRAALPDTRTLTRALESRFFALTIRDETRPKQDLWSGAGEDTLRGFFLQTLRTQYDAAADDETRRKIARAAKFGLDAMENRLEVDG